MKSLVPTLLIPVLLAGCGAAEQAATPAAPTPVIIDDTPVEPLAIGGSMLALQVVADLSDPENADWRQAQEYQMDLGLAPPVHPSINLRYDATTAPLPVFLRAATDGEKLYLRLRWQDASQDASSTLTEFADAAAVQFALGDGPADGSPNTSFMMGAPNGPVNIWYWKAGQGQAQNLAAGGFGSTTPVAPAGLNVSSVYRSGGEWVVVFSRPLQAEGEHQVPLGQGSASMAFALWQGEQQQRDGLKHVSMGWVTLQPAAGGPTS